jgi:glycosyltransferase involved in cell wall biosynthesis
MTLNNILFITVSYPFGSGEQFIAGEIKHLSDKCEQLLIFPSSSSGAARRVPGNVTVVRKSKIHYWIMILVGFFYSLPKYRKFYKADLLATIKAERLSIFRFSRLAYILVYLARSCRFIAWFDLYYKGHARSGLIYTYWMNAEAYGVSILKRYNPSLKTVSRVHGGDLYKERNFGFLPFREPVVDSLDRIFPISNQGKKYLTAEYGAYLEDKIVVSRLGVQRSDILYTAYKKDRITIASCSSDDPVKRVHAIVEAVGSLSNAVSVQVIWVHIGIEKNHFLKKYGRFLDCYKNLRCVVEGVVPHERVNEIYKKYYPNVFINLSSSEGVPVSIMEALSMGIPIIATDVGGSSEIVDRQVGALVSSEIDIRVIEKEIETIVQFSRQYSKAAYERWNHFCDESSNYENHYHHLKEVQGD